MNDIKCKNCFYLYNDWCDKIIDEPDKNTVRDCPYYKVKTMGDDIRRLDNNGLAKLFTDIFVSALEIELTSEECDRVIDGYIKILNKEANG